MTGVQRALHRLLMADNAKVALSADSPAADKLWVATASMASLYVDAHCLIRRVSGPSAIDLKVVRVYAMEEIDATTWQLSIEPALPALPKATDEIRLGVVHWLRGGNMLKVRKPAYSTPVQELGDQAATHEVVVIYGERDRTEIFARAWEGTWEIRSVSRSPRHALGCAERIHYRLAGGAAALRAQAKGLVIGEVAVSDVEEAQRDDKLYEWLVRMRIQAAAKVA